MAKWSDVSVKGEPTGALTPDSIIQWGRYSERKCGKATPYKDIDRGWLRWAIENADLATDEEKAIMRQILDGDQVRLDGSDETHDQKAWREARERADKLECHLQRAREAITNLERDLTARRDEVRKLTDQLKKRPASQPIIQMTDNNLFARVIRQAYGACSRLHHPDRGGTTERQAVVNQCFRELRSRLEQACQAANGEPKTMTR